MGYRIASNCIYLDRAAGDRCRAPALQRTGWRRWLFGSSPRCVFSGVYPPRGVTCAEQVQRMRPPPPASQVAPMAVIE
jgi:hypothetical protein